MKTLILVVMLSNTARFPGLDGFPGLDESTVIAKFVSYKQSIFHASVAFVKTSSRHALRDISVVSVMCRATGNVALKYVQGRA